MGSAKSRKSNNDLTTNVSTLKTHLGRFLKKVKNGEEVIVLDRQTPVAKLVSFTGTEEVLIEKPATKTWQEIEKQLLHNDKKRKTSKIKKPSLFYLNEDRGK